MFKIDNKNTRKVQISRINYCKITSSWNAKFSGFHEDTKHTRKAIIYQCFFNRMAVTLIHKTGKKICFS